MKLSSAVARSIVTALSVQDLHARKFKSIAIRIRDERGLKKQSQEGSYALVQRTRGVVKNWELNTKGEQDFGKKLREGGIFRCLVRQQSNYDNNSLLHCSSDYWTLLWGRGHKLRITGFRDFAHRQNF
jgi:hypothetical protein